MIVLNNLLMSKLNDDNYDLTKIDIDEIIKIYNHVMSFVLESTDKEYNGNEYDPRFLFLFKEKDSYGFVDNYCFNIIKFLIELKKNNLLNLIDYTVLTYICVDYRNSYRVKELNDYLSDIIILYEKGKDRFHDRYIETYRHFMNNFLNTDFIEDLAKSKYVSKEYLDIIMLYKDLFDKYYEVYYEIERENRKNYYDIDFYDLLNLSFYYFLFNDLLINESKNVYNMLDYINKNTDQIIDNFHMSGVKNRKEILKYVDVLYHNDFNKTITIK